MYDFSTDFLQLNKRKGTSADVPFRAMGPNKIYYLGGRFFEERAPLL